GGNGGYSWGRANTDQTDSSTTSTVTQCFRDATSAAITGGTATQICSPPGTALTFPVTTGPTTAAAVTSGRANVNGFVGGLQTGYNYQFARSWVLGFETDFQYSGERGSQQVCSDGVCAAGSAFGSSSTSLKWFGTARARLGFLPVDRIMVYATGGLAYGQLSTDYLSGINGTTLLAGSVSTWRAGWTAGGGIEGAISDRWTLKVEYLYADYGSYGANLGTGAAVTTVGPFVPSGIGLAGTRTTTTTTVSSVVNTRFTDNIVRVGLNYRFGPDAVVARY
ncbi:MAG: porin family protein, partial [Alphaproteobacteria bacterium]|nr:porin family protein [Alphaproteobacteria bacterium]